MTELCFGRYFLLENDTNTLFQWLTQNIGDDWKIEVIGVCPTEDKLILNASFQSEEHLKLLETGFIDDQSRYSAVYNNRRSPSYKWPSAAERRVNNDRRAELHRRSPTRSDSRRLEDVVKRALSKKKENKAIAAE